MKMILRIPFIFTAAIALSGCPGGGGSGDISLGSSTSGGGLNGSVSLQITKIQNQTSGSWITDTAGKVYLKTGAIRLDGTCTRGVSTISAAVNSVAVPETATCQGDGTFTWTKTYSGPTPATGTLYDIVLSGVDTNGTVISGVDDEKKIVVDLTAPTAPVLDAVAGCHLSSGSWICASTHVEVTGSWSSAEDVVSLQIPGSGTVTYPTSNTFAFDFTLAEGQSRTLSFTVTDRAGNVSGVSSETTVYASTATALASGANSGGTVVFAGGPLGSAASMIGNTASLSGKFYDKNSAQPASERAQLLIGPVSIGAEHENP